MLFSDELTVSVNKQYILVKCQTVQTKLIIQKTNHFFLFVGTFAQRACVN